MIRPPGEVTELPVGDVQAQVFALVLREARLLDEGRLEDWLDLFAPDGIYWLPMDDTLDPEEEPSLLFDDARRRSQRVKRLRHRRAYAQVPPSRTVHVVTNLEVIDPGESTRSNPTVVRCNLVVHEARGGDHRQHGLGIERSMAGTTTYELVRLDDDLRILSKKVLLIGRDMPLENLTFIV